MTAAPPGGPSPRVLSESLAALAAQVADLRGQVHASPAAARARTSPASVSVSNAASSSGPVGARASRRS
jgi:hypothetical protein